MGTIHRASAVHLSVRVLCCALLLSAAACASTPEGDANTASAGPGGRAGGPSTALPPALPDSTGFGVHVLAVEHAPNGATWVGTYGNGVLVMRPGAKEWERLPVDSTAISWGFVNSIAFEDSSTIWYGTVGNGFGRSKDGGRTFRNWTFAQLGPEWQYVAPGGIIARDATVYIATADGLRITANGGDTWRCIQDAGRSAGGAARREDGCTERINALPTEYLLSLDVGPDRTIWVGHLLGLSTSRDGGTTWTNVDAPGIAGARVRAVRATADSAVWVATEDKIFVDSTGRSGFVEAPVRVPGFAGLPGKPRDLIAAPSFMPVPRPDERQQSQQQRQQQQQQQRTMDPRRQILPLVKLPPAIATSYGLVARTNEGGYRVFYLGAGDRYRPASDIWAAAWWPPSVLLGGSGAGLARILAGDLPATGVIDAGLPAQPQEPKHLWFRRPIAQNEGNPHIDATYRYGSTMGGNFQQHQGVEFNNAAGTPVHAVGDGVVVFAGPAEAGANTVAIRHDRQWEGQYVFTTYYHNTSLAVRSGQRVSAGDVIARVGNTGRATNDHMHLEVHVAPSTDSAKIVHPDVRFPPYTVNPQLWIEPMPGTGIVAGRVFDAAGQPIQGARIHGLVLPYPEETPFSFAETYRERAHGDPAYQDHFAVGDVPAGEYTIGVQIGDRKVWRRVRVTPGMVTWVEFRP
jgi:murein DD-endopeptidase MepM/ murein hydrolase activator NlpD